MVRRCICYAINSNYLFPAVASALQLRPMVSEASADILIFGIDISQAMKRDFAHICAANNIVFKSLASRTLDGYSGLYANIFLDRFVPDVYTDIIYVDADVQFWRPVKEFVEHSVPSGQFLAAADPMMFELGRANGRSRELERYMTGLGLNRDGTQIYFNSGVIHINRDGWNELGMEALQFLKKWPQLCRFDDQSALNAVAAGRNRPLSLRWNFPIFFRNLRIEQAITPSIYHFMSQPKPWHGSFPPWNDDFTHPYAAIPRADPNLAIYLGKLSRLKQTRYLAQQWMKRAREKVSWGVASRDKIMAYEAMTTSIPAKSPQS